MTMRIKPNLPLLYAPSPRLAGLVLIAMSVSSYAFAQQDVFTAKAGVTETRDDNIFRLPDNNSLATSGQLAGPRADVIRSTFFGLNINRDISRQHVALDATLTDTKYRDHPGLDNTGNSIRATWNGVYGNQWRNDVTFENRKQLSNFSDTRSTQKNIVENRSFVDSLSYAITPRFSAQAGFGTTRIKNSVELLNISDYSTDYREVGLAYTSPSNNQIKVNYRQTNGKYPNPQFVTFVANQSLTAVSNNYMQRDLDVSSTWAITGVSNVNARIGVTRRHYDSVSSRDFNGSTGSLTYNWNPGGKLSMNAELRRGIGSTSDVTSSYFLTDSISLRPSWTPTAKITVSGNFDWTKRNALGDPVRAFNLDGAQNSRTRTTGLTVSYSPIKHIDLALRAIKESRQSNTAAYDFQDNLVALTANITY